MLTGATEVLHRYPSQCHFVYHKSLKKLIRSEASGVRVRQITAWAMAWPGWDWNSTLLDTAHKNQQFNELATTGL